MYIAGHHRVLSTVDSFSRTAAPRVDLICSGSGQVVHIELSPGLSPF